MRALLYKDVTVLKKTLLLLLVILGLVSIYAVHEEAVTVLPLMFILIPLILLGILFGADAQSGVDCYLVAGPVQRKTIVLSRYLLVWGLAILGSLFTLGICLFGGEEAYPLPWYLVSAAMLLAVSLLAAVQLPLMYKFGEEKARLVFVILYFLVFAAFSYLGSLEEGSLDSLFEAISRLNPRLTALLLLLVTILLNGISLAISLRIYEKKEF